MTILFTIFLVLSLVIVAYGCFTWRAAGRSLVVGGTTNAALFAYLLLQHSASGLQYTFLAIVLALNVGVFATMKRSVWRQFRLHLMPGGAVILVLLGMLFFPDVPQGVKIAVSALLGVLTISFLAVGMIQVHRSIRAAMK